MAQKPRLSFWQIWNMSFGFLGIQFGFALQNANVSRIFETLGADVDQIPILWIAAPLTGLIVQPIIGHMSDRTWGRLGRRRPYFLIGAILASIALLIMPNSPTLWIAAGMLWIMDASINISMEPFRAFVGDNLPDEQRTEGFAMQSFFIGTGAVIASALPWMLTNWFDVSNTASGGGVAPSVKWSFYLGGAVFFVAVLWTVIRSREYSPEEMEAFEEHDAKLRKEEPEAAKDSKRKGDFEVVMKHKPPASTENMPAPSLLQRQGLFWLLGGTVLTLLIYLMELGKQELYIVGFGALIFGVMMLAASRLIASGRIHGGFIEVMSDLMHMPKTMKQLAVVQFFSWFALFSMWIYSTSAVTRHYYDMQGPASIAAELQAFVPALPPEKQAELSASLLEMLNSREALAGEEVYIPVKVSGAFTDGVILSERELVEGYERALASSSPGGSSASDTESSSKKSDLDKAREEVLSLGQAFRAGQSGGSLSPSASSALQEAGVQPVGLDPTKVALLSKLKSVQKEYNNGGDWIGIIFMVYNGVAALVAFLIPMLARVINRRRTHMLCMVIGGVGLASVFIFRQPEMLILSMVLVGVAWASILSMPYAILSGALPLKKMGVYMGIFNFFIVIPQLVAASILGFLVLRFFDNDPIYALLVGGLSMMLAGLLTLRVEDAKDTAPA